MHVLPEKCNVVKFTDKLLTKIETKKPGLYNRSIEMIESENKTPAPINVEINGEKSSYICHASKNHLQPGKLLPISAMNGLKIYKQDPDLELTELEVQVASTKRQNNRCPSERERLYQYSYKST